MLQTLALFLLLMCSCQIGNGQTDNDGIFTSNADLQSLIWTEKELVRGLQKYVQEEEFKLEKLKEYLKEYEDLESKAEKDSAEVFVGNPLNSFLLIKKMTSDWKRVQNLISESPAQNFLQNLTLQRDYYRWPSEEDLSGAAIGLMRLQDTYKLETADLSRGTLNGVSYGPILTAHDCFELGRQAYNNGDHYHTNLWMNEALNKLGDEEEKTASKSDILEYMAFSAYVQGNMRRALKLTEDLLVIDPYHPRAEGNKMYYEKELTEKGGDMTKKGEDMLGDVYDPNEVTIAEEHVDLTKTDEKLYYEKLCRGENQITEAYRAKLKCRYTEGFSPFLKIGPYKEEDIFLKPRLVMYHEVLAGHEIDTIKDLATPKFKRATVQNYKTGELETASYRISKTAWLKRDEHEHIERVYQRVGDVTGLNMETSEELQVSNYGIGGHYEPHFDFARREEKNAFASLGTGNRIATWLFYESDVDQGGATVFPQLSIGLWPKKGSAVFWYNLHKNGEGDDMTRHAACPVLAGSKWVSNFWIHERGQEFARPCSLSPFE